MIIGEIKRFLRDDGILKVSRSIKENQYKICKMREELEKKLGREPDLRTFRCYGYADGRIGDDAGIGCRGGFYLQDCVSGRWNGFAACGQASGKEDRHEKLLNRIFLEEILEKLEGEEKRLIVFRYFQDMTQTEVAKKMGMSQVQISRMEKKY